MEREEALRLLREHQDELRRLGVDRLALFGSVARDEAGPGSDVDLLVRLRPEARIGLFGFVRLKTRLEEILGRPVDLVTEDSVKRQLREQIFGEAVPAA